MRKNKYIFVVITLLFSCLCFPMDKVSAESSMAEVPLTVKQSFELKNAEKEVELTGKYELRALDVDAPMPNNTKDNLYSFLLEGEQAEATVSLQYLHGGVYHYQLLQTTKDKEPYQYDRSCYNIIVYVKNGEKGQLIPQVVAEKEDGNKYVELQFNNSYNGKTPESSKTLESKGVVNTGDQTNLIAYVLVATSSLLLIILLAYPKRQNQEKQ